ncbi:MFS transporter [Streptomyces sp. DSM 44915]|uniref:MFS transporter n=1 Tax=Streptomyces chisholmiae TaxID=3075540 RepID=A0ABU2JXL2_9ACTN|nr:MFS transporter [Streptomyces sp. DSM 44915]MDT0269484.1 MFS transporter [Streptomyces sp. DSM 44915]
MRRGGGGGRRAGLGRPFHTLWAAAVVSNIGDGVTLAAAPLLVASLTDSPALVGWAVFVQQLPWLLFSLISGVFVDRLDRRRLIVVVNLPRGALVGGPIAGVLGVTGPFWLAAGVMAVLTAVAWRPFGRRVAQSTRGGPGGAAAGGETGRAGAGPADGWEPPRDDEAAPGPR